MRTVREIATVGIVGFALAILIFACGGGDEGDEGAYTSEELQQPQVENEMTAAKLWTQIHEDLYTDWMMWPGKDSLYEGTEPHGVLLTTYVNDEAHEAASNNAGEMPHGAIIVKENYKPDSSLAAITVMNKIKDYNSVAKDWFWAKYGPEGNVMAEGKVASCIDCHVQAKDNDYIMTDR